MADETWKGSLDYKANQEQMIADTRRARIAADADFARARRQGAAPLPLKFCQNCYALGVSAGIEQERAKKRPWYTYGFAVLMGVFLGLLIAAAISWVHAGRWHFVGF